MRESVLAQLRCALGLNLRVRWIPECQPGKVSLPDGRGISR